MTRERARSERRDVDKERGEPLAGGAARGGPRALRTPSRPVPEWTSRPRILVTNDDGVESRGLLALKQALEPMGDVTVVAPDTNQSAVGHQKTLMRPLRVRERTLADGSLGLLGRRLADRRRQPRLPRLLRARLRPRRRRASTTGRTWATTSPTRGRSARRWRRSSTTARRSPSRRSTTSIPTSPWPAMAATIVARNILDPRPVARRAHQRQRAGGDARGVRGHRGHPARAAGLLRPARRAAGPARHPLLLDRRPAAVRAGRPRHRLPRGRQPAHRGHADPPRPDRPAPAARSSRPGSWTCPQPAGELPAADATATGPIDVEPDDG